MSIINKIEINNSDLIITHDGSSPGPSPSPSPTPSPGPSSDKVIMAYYGQWDIYDGNFPVPSHVSAVADIYSKITHLAYGFMGFNSTGAIGTWDGNADLAVGTQEYGQDFYSKLHGDSGSFPNWGSGYSIGYPFQGQQFPTSTITGHPTNGAQFYRLAYAKYINSKMKIIMSFGGWEYNNAGTKDTTWISTEPPSQVFYKITQDDNTLTKFVNNIADMITNYKFQMFKHGTKYTPVPYSTPTGDINNPHINDNVISGELEAGYTRVGGVYSIFSGVDIDWEYPSGCGQCSSCTGMDPSTSCPDGWTPNASEKILSYNGYAKLLKLLKEKLPSPYYVSTTMGGDPGLLTDITNNQNIVDSYKLIDHVSVMTYDFMNGNNVVMHDSPLYNQTANTPGGILKWNADAGVKILLSKIPSTKINMGVPNYGRFQYIKDSTLIALGYTGGIPTQEITNKIFSGSTECLYTACGQSSPSKVTCPWINGGEIQINSINYDITPSNGLTIPPILCGGNCNFGDPVIKNAFYEVNDTRVGVTYYLSKTTYNGTDIFNNENVRIMLSMPSKYSIDQKTKYINDNNLGGAISWMIGNDTSFVLAGYLHDGLK